MYLTFSEFKKIFPESDMSDEQFETVEMRAESDIDTLTFNRITEKGFENLTVFQKERIRHSTALQINFIHNNSELIDSPISAYSISGVSMSFDKSKVIILCGVTTTNQMYNSLMQTGLCYRGLM